MRRPALRSFPHLEIRRLPKMKRIHHVALLALILAITLTGCSSEAERQRQFEQDTRRLKVNSCRGFVLVATGNCMRDVQSVCDAEPDWVSSKTLIACYRNGQSACNKFFVEESAKCELME